MNIRQAQEFILSRVIDPALSSPHFAEEYRGTLQSTKNKILGFKRVGDLCRYMARFTESESSDDGVVRALHDINLPAFEEIRDGFLAAAGQAQFDVTTINSLVVGDYYSGMDISIISENYNQLSGIYPVENGRGDIEAVLIKCTLDGGAYPNEWLIEGQTLKYYLKAVSGNFSEHYKVNRSIIESGDSPIYVFIKIDKAYKLSGLFSFQSLHTEDDGSKWFELERINSHEENEKNALTEEAIKEDFVRRFSKSQTLSNEALDDRIARSRKVPKKITSNAVRYERNSDVVERVLRRANGVCELCAEPAPFITKAGRPYLEVHHKVMLADGGEDTPENAVALCPNCHKKAHFAEEEVVWP